MPIDAMHKELLIRMSLFLGNENHKRLSCTAKPFKNLDIEKALCSESVTIDGYLLNKIRLYTLPDTTNQDIDQPRAEASTTAIKELVIASDAAKDLTNDDLEKLAKLGFIHEKTETINLKNCDQITDLSPLASCTALTSINLENCDQITDQILSTLPVLPELIHLNLENCDQITDLSPLQSYTALTSLGLGGCNQITDQILSTLPILHTLKDLTLDDCTQISDLSPLASCTALTSLGLGGCNQITDISPLASCTELTSLDLSCCPEITDLSPLASCTALTSLDPLGCDQITDLSPLASCTALKSLNLYLCRGITNLSPLANHPTLSELIGPDGEEVDLTSLSNTQQPGP